MIGSTSHRKNMFKSSHLGMFSAEVDLKNCAELAKNTCKLDLFLKLELAFCKSLEQLLYSC